MKERRLTVLAILLLLVALSVSSGEGLRLFPIPVANAAAENKSGGEISSSDLQTYQYGARCIGTSADRGSTGKSKHQRDRSAAGSFLEAFTAPVLALSPSQTSLFYNSTPILSPGSRAIPDSRGPPVS